MYFPLERTPSPPKYTIIIAIDYFVSRLDPVQFENGLRNKKE